MKLEQIILKNLIYNDEYVKKVFPFLKDEYFHNSSEKILFKEIEKYIGLYNSSPTYESLVIQLNDSNINEIEFENVNELLKNIYNNRNENSKIDWLIDSTEKFCQDQAIYNGVVESISIIEGKNKQLDKGSIPSILQKALSVCFDNNIGHDYTENWQERYDYYHRLEEKLPFDITLLNTITKNGFARKTLNLFLGGTHSGKTLIKIHLASHYLNIGSNVLFITLEMSEEEIAKRIDANIFNLTIDKIENMPFEEYSRYIEKIKTRQIGRLIVKQFPTGAAHVGHFNNLINELALKKNFFPDIIIIDYLGICASVRYKSMASVNSYGYFGAVSKELRGFAIEHDVPIISSAQLNREGNKNSDPDLSSIAESFAINMDADLVLSIIRTDELKELGQVMIKQLKNRYRDLSLNNRFVLGMDTNKMKLFDLESFAQEDIINYSPEVKLTEKFKGAFDDFKFDM